MTQPFTTSEEHDLVLAAFTHALSEGLRVAKTGEANAGSYGYSYAELSNVLAAIHSALGSKGAFISQIPSGSNDGNTPGVWTLTNTIFHSSGQWMAFAPYMRPQVRDEQGFGGALTYGRRYSLLAIFGIRTPDDDAAEVTRQQRNTVQYDGNRTPEELAIRQIIKIQSEENRKQLVDAFKGAMGKGLADLPENKHDAALRWTLQWVAEPPTPEPTTEETNG